MDSGLNRLKMICKWCHIGTCLVSVVIIVLILALLSLIGLVALYPDAIDMSTIHVDEIDGELTAGQFVGLCILTTLMLVLLLAILIVLGNIFKSINREYSPFIESNYRRFMIVASLNLMSLLFIPFENIVGLNVDYASNTLTVLFVSLLIYTLALIFRYGQYLQKESDETL